MKNENFRIYILKGEMLRFIALFTRATHSNISILAVIYTDKLASN